jgi:AbrB family looped-hinge helix DNA binding protein
VGPKGQVVIPKEIRDYLGIAPGDEVDVALDGDAVRFVPSRRRTNLRGRFAGVVLVERLAEDRRRELER